MEEPGQESPRLRDWLWALLRLRATWPLPALLLLALLLSFLPAEAWQSTMSRRRQWSKAELAMVMSGLGTLLYWLTLLLAHLGLLNAGSRSLWMMREPSEAELAIAAIWVHALCLLLAYSGPALLLFAP